MGVPKKMSESHWGTYFIWPFRCSGFLGGSRISSKMVSLHLPGENHSFGNRSNGLAGWLQTTGGTVDVSSGSLTSDCLEGQQLDVFPTRVGRAVVLAQSTAVFLVGALHLLHHLGLWQERRGGGERVSWEAGDGWAAEMRVELTRFAEDSSHTTDRGKNGNLQ